MTNTNRLTIEMIREDIEKTKMSVIAGEWFFDDGATGACGCPMAIHYVSQRRPDIFDPDFADRFSDIEFGFPYAAGFVAGFDVQDAEVYAAEFRSQTRFQEGLEDGIAARKEFIVQCVES